MVLVHVLPKNALDSDYALLQIVITSAFFFFVNISDKHSGQNSGSSPKDKILLRFIHWMQLRKASVTRTHYPKILRPLPFFFPWPPP